VVAGDLDSVLCSPHAEQQVRAIETREAEGNNRETWGNPNGSDHVEWTGRTDRWNYSANVARETAREKVRPHAREDSRA